jgi:DNA-binding FadR family transcriptional regulator
MASSKLMNDLLIDHKQGHPLSSIIYTKVVEQILQGDFGPSGKLPAENDLAIQFNVSRSTIREALSRLRADGVIESRRKAGTFVIRNPQSGPLTHIPIKNFGDIEEIITQVTHPGR